MVTNQRPPSRHHRHLTSFFSLATNTKSVPNTTKNNYRAFIFICKTTSPSKKTSRTNVNQHGFHQHHLNKKNHSVQPRQPLNRKKNNTITRQIQQTTTTHPKKTPKAIPWRQECYLVHGCAPTIYPFQKNLICSFFCISSVLSFSVQSSFVFAFFAPDRCVIVSFLFFVSSFGFCHGCHLLLPQLLVLCSCFFSVFAFFFLCSFCTCRTPCNIALKPSQNIKKKRE